MEDCGRQPNDDNGGGGGGGGGEIVISAAASMVALPIVGRKPRGRPPGSKNKPKPPVVITRESESAMRPLVIELAGGCDVVDTLARFALRRRVGLSVLSGSGAISNVVLHHRGAALPLAGRFDILSLAGTLLPPDSAAVKCPFAVSLAGAQGHVIGGTVVGPMTAAGTVVVVAAAFQSPEFCRLPPLPEEEAPPPHDMVLWANPAPRNPHSPPPPY